MVPGRLLRVRAAALKAAWILNGPDVRGAVLFVMVADC